MMVSCYGYRGLMHTAMPVSLEKASTVQFNVAKRCSSFSHPVLLFLNAKYLHYSTQFSDFLFTLFRFLSSLKC